MTDWITLITPIVAIWGATLSTLLFIVRICENRKAIYLKLKLHYILPEDWTKSLKIELKLECANKSKRPIQINAVGIETDSGTKVIAIYKEAVPVDFPIYLDYAQGKTIPFNIENVLIGFVSMESKGLKSFNAKKIRAFVVDALDKEMFSNYIDFDVKGLLKYFPNIETK